MLLVLADALSGFIKSYCNLQCLVDCLRLIQPTHLRVFTQHPMSLIRNPSDIENFACLFIWHVVILPSFIAQHFLMQYLRPLVLDDHKCNHPRHIRTLAHRLGMPSAPPSSRQGSYSYQSPTQASAASISATSVGDNAVIIIDVPLPLCLSSNVWSRLR